MSKNPKTIFEEVFSRHRVRSLWTANYFPAIPFTPNNFDIGSILPPMLYMIRWGYRRGVGAFEKTFGVIDGGRPTPPDIAGVAQGLLSRESSLENFNSPAGKAVLCDLLLAWCLENKEHALGHSAQIQRTFPTHYLSSWIDLPKSNSDLRGIPELLVAVLSGEESAAVISSSLIRNRYPVGVGFDDNPLLSLFGRHMAVRGEHLADTGFADHLLEEKAVDLGIDEILAIRIAKACEHAPGKARGKNEREGIPNQNPLARRATEHLRDDLRVLIEVYGRALPRQAFLQMFESAVSLGLTNILLSTSAMLMKWEVTGILPLVKEQEPWPLFVDVSQGQDSKLRDLSESSTSDTLRRYERLPVITMLLRILEDKLNDLNLDDLPARSPNATDFINLLGQILHGSHQDSADVIRDLRKDCGRLAKALEDENEAEEVVNLLKNGSVLYPVRFAESVIELMGRNNQHSKYLAAVESCLMTNRPHGLAIKRRVKRSENGLQRSLDLRSIVLSSTLLDFLAHRHLRIAAKGMRERFLSLRQFMDILRTNYGLYIDQAPPGLPVSQVLLLSNKQWLERRLRDLGLLVGVNDAESMKQLKVRYQPNSVGSANNSEENIKANAFTK